MPGNRRDRTASPARSMHLLLERDPLSEKVHLGKPGVLAARVLVPPKDWRVLPLLREPPPPRPVAHERRVLGGGPSRCVGARTRQLVLTRRCAFFRARAARRCSKSIPSAAPSTTSPTKAGRASRVARRSPNGAAISTALYARERARPVRACMASCKAIHAFDLRQEDFLRRHRRHGNGCRSRYSRARSRDARSLLRPGRERRRAPFRVARLRHARSGRRGLAHHLGRAFQLTNILRDLDEDAGIGRLYLPREDLLARPASTRDDAARGPGESRSGAACAPSSRARRSILRAAAGIMARCPRASVRAPRIMAEVYRADSSDRLDERGFAPPRQQNSHAPRILRRSCATVLRCGLVLMARPVVHIIGAGLAGLAAAVRLAGGAARSLCTRPPARRADAAAPISTRRSA